jgi:thiol peroxidase
MTQVTFLGNPVELSGELPGVGTEAPYFKLPDKELVDRSLSEFTGKKRLLNIVPSLDTPVCATSTRRFNELLAERDDVVVLVVSADLPFAQGRFCTSEGLQHVIPLSLMRGKGFATDYGVLINNGPLAGLTGRAVVLVDENGKVAYTQLVQEIADEPDYAAVMAALG